MSNEMVERVIAEMAECYVEALSTGDTARRVIAAMREPTAEMMAVMSQSPIEYQAAFLKIWQAMIDAALAYETDKWIDSKTENLP